MEKSSTPRLVHGLDPDDTSRPPVARLNSGGLPIDAGQTHKVWRGQVQVDGCLEPCIPVAIKWMPGQAKLPIELACSLAAAELSLPVPRGIVVLAMRDQLPGLPATARPLPGTTDYLCFGSLYQWPDDSITRFLDNEAVAEYTWRKLCDLPVASQGAAWDELAANHDRHVKNLIYTGTDRREYMFIDHELALEPIATAMRNWAAQRTRQSILDHRARVNQVAAQLTKRRPNDHDMLAQPARLSRAQRRVELLADKVRQWSTGHSQIDPIWPLVEVVLRGIATRLPALDLMMHERLRVPSAKDLWNSSSNPKNPAG